MVQQSKELTAAHKKQRLALQQQQHKEKLGAQRKLAKKRAAARCPYQPHHTLLLIGEGNFSFARSLIAAPPTAGFTPLPGCNLTATCYDSFAVARDKYADVQDNIDALRAAGARVWDSIDATQLHSDSSHFPAQPAAVSLLSPPPLSHYDFIVFNFPHTGSGITDTHKNNQQHQQLLTAFLHSLARAPHLLSPTTRLHLTVKRGEPYSSWHVPLLPRSLPSESKDSVRFVTSVPFYPHLYPLYQHRRTIGFKDGLSADGNDDIEGGAMTHVFMRVAESGGAADDEKTDGESEKVRLLPVDKQAAGMAYVEEQGRSAVSESVDGDEQPEARHDNASQRKPSLHTPELATEQPVVLAPMLTGRSRFSSQTGKGSKAKRPAQQLKPQLNLRGLLFT